MTPGAAADSMPADDDLPGRSAAVSIGGGGPRRGGGGEHELTYSQSLNERNTFYFNRSTAGPSSGPSDPTMLPPVLELPPSMEATAGSPPRLATLSASAPASTSAVGRCDSLPHPPAPRPCAPFAAGADQPMAAAMQLEGHVPEHAPVQGGRRAREDHAGWDADDLLLPDEHNGRSCGGEGRIRRCERAAKVVRLDFPGGARKRCAASLRPPLLLAPAALSFLKSIRCWQTWAAWIPVQLVATATATAMTPAARSPMTCLI